MWDLLRAYEAGSHSDKELAVALNVTTNRISALKRTIRFNLTNEDEYDLTKGRIITWETAVERARERYDLSKRLPPVE